MRLGAPLLAFLAAGAAEAQTVPVRTGEHEGFTRVVLAAPELEGWTIESVPGGFEIAVPGAGALDVGRAFRRLSSGRVATIETGGAGRLNLGIACDCHAEARIFPGIGLVVDVLDGPPPPGGLVPGRKPAPPPAEVGPASPAPVRQPSAPSSAPPAMPRGTDAALAQGVASALSHGLLDMAPGARRAASSPRVADAPASASGVLPAPFPASPAAPPQPSVPGLAFRTGADPGHEARTPLGAAGTPCLPAEAFDLAGWAGDGRLGDALAAGIARLTDARDRIDPEAVETLARTYLAYGFGREAAMTLDLDGRASRERDRLRLLARVVDGEAVDPAALDDQAACLGPVALWRALARGSLAGLGDRERAAIAVALQELPPAVRGAIALRVADLHLANGDATAAAEVAALAARHGTDARLAEARAARAADEAEHALEGYGDLIEGDAHPTPEALVELIDLSVAEGRPVREPTLELVRSLRAEHGGAAGRALLLAEARALAAQDRFDEAVTVLEAERAEHPGPDVEAALSATVLAFVGRASDAAFLESALGRLPDDLPADARDAVAGRLVALGFPPEDGPPRESPAPASPAPAPPAPTPEPPAPPQAGPGPDAVLDPMSLAARRDLLVRAEEARSRAAELLSQAPSAGP